MIIVRNDLPHILSVKDVAKLLKKRERTIREMCYSRQIPHYKVGRTILFDLDVLLKWLKTDCKVEPIINPSLSDLKKLKNHDGLPPALVSDDQPLTRYR